MSDIYCEQLIPGNIKANIIEETENVLAFDHTNPYWEKHVVIIPKKHITSLTSFEEEDEAIISELVSVAKKICKRIEDECGGCRLSTNIGNYQSSKHLHFYAHSGEKIRNEDGSVKKH